MRKPEEIIKEFEEVLKSIENLEYFDTCKEAFDLLNIAFSPERKEMAEALRRDFIKRHCKECMCYKFNAPCEMDCSSRDLYNNVIRTLTGESYI